MAASPGFHGAGLPEALFKRRSTGTFGLLFKPGGTEGNPRAAGHNSGSNARDDAADAEANGRDDRAAAEADGANEEGLRSKERAEELALDGRRKPIGAKRPQRTTPASGDEAGVELFGHAAGEKGFTASDRGVAH